MTRIGLIHAVPVAIEPVRRVLASVWPEADCVSLLDDSLSRDLSRDGELTPVMYQRICALGDYTLLAGANGILFTCSAFGAAIEAFAATTHRPVLKPNEAMFRAAMKKGRRIGMLATFRPAVASMEDEFTTMARKAFAEVTIRTVLVEEALAALQRGDAEMHDSLLAEAVFQLRDCDAIMLAHFSTSRAAAAVSRAVRQPVLTAPQCAVEALRSRCAAIASVDAG